MTNNPKYIDRGCREESEWITMKVVFWVFFVGILLLLILIAATGFYFANSPMDMMMIHLFLYACLWSSLGGLMGGHIGAMMEEDSCGSLDMGILSSMGSLVANLIIPLAGSAAVGLSLYVPWTYLWGATLLFYVILFFGMNRYSLSMSRQYETDHCGWRVDAKGERLPIEKQPLRMKNLLAIILGAVVGVYCILTVYMAVKMGNELWNGVMLGGMMYAMGGACLGGMASGWLAGLLDWHVGAPEHDNPIMVAGMSLMTGMMGAMAAAMLGGMMGVMGAGPIAATLVAAALLSLLTYRLFIVKRYRLSVRRRESLPPPAQSANSTSCCG